jgi:Ca2+-binding RTX toxin-like protein
MLSPVARTDAPSQAISSGLHALSSWAAKPSAETDLEKILGPQIDWSAAYRLLHAFRIGDFSALPPVTFLEPHAMPGIWAGYSRDLRRIVISRDCPLDLLPEALLEEIGHFLDHALSPSETPGDEGAALAAAILEAPLSATQHASLLAEDSLHPVAIGDSIHQVEAMSKRRGSGNSKPKVRGSGNKDDQKIRANDKPTTPPLPAGNIISQDGSVVYTKKIGARLFQTKDVQRVIGSRGNDTFVVKSRNVRLEDPNGGKDTVETKVSFDISKFRFIENLTATPTLSGAKANVTLGGNSKANAITGNRGNNKLDGGNDSARDTLIGGKGNDTYVLRDSLDSVIEAANGGTDTIETTLNDASLARFNAANVENLSFIGSGSATLVGNNLANVITGGVSADTLIGGSGTTPADILRGGRGDDVYIVSRQSDRIVENGGPLDGTDTIRTSAATYSMAAFANVENLVYTGGSASRLTGNSGNNTITGGNFVRNIIDGGSGDDYLIGGNTTDNLIGGLGNDTLVVTRWADTPVGALGTSLVAGGGADILNGGAGADWYVVNSQSAYTFEETGTDRDTIASTVSYSLNYNKNISDNIENLYLIGNQSLTGTGSDKANEITGNDGNNTLRGGADSDTLYGGLGADLIHGDSDDDTIFGGGQPQTDLPASASTAITMRPGESYTGKIDFRRDTDWIRAKLSEGVTYTFELTYTPFGNPALRQFSDAAFGQSGRDITPYTISQNWWFLFSEFRNTSFHPFIGDQNADLDSLLFRAGSRVNEANHRNDHTLLVLNQNGERADGAVDYSPYDPADTNSNANIIRFEFTPFSTGEYYIPISGAGPLGGAYTVTLTDPETAGGTPTAILADDGQNTLVGGTGKDYLVAGNGRDSLGAPIGDILLGGTNGVPGSIDLDTSSDTLIGGDGGDLLDGGRGLDSMVGGAGNDTYFIDQRTDEVVEQDDGGTDDLGIFSYAAGRVFATDLTAGLFALTDPALDSLTGAGFDVDLANVFTNVEHASLMGSANLYVLGNSDPNSLFGNFGNNLLVGAVGDDTLDGKGGNDYLIGGDGGDSLDGGSGQNTMDGGLGSDTYVVNDRNDRIIKEIEGLDGGVDLVRTYFNFDPIQGDGVNQFDPFVPDNSPSVTKSQSFASQDLQTFYNLENFELLGQAAYGVGNALNNSMSASDGASALLLGMGGEDILRGGARGDSLYGDTPRFYALPDLYAPAPTDTRTQEFLDKVVGQYGSDYLDGGAGDDYLDGGRSFDTMVGGQGNDTYIKDHVDDYIVATVEDGQNGQDELISSVNISQAPDGITELMLVVKDQDRDAARQSITGQEQAASFASFNGSKGGNQGVFGYDIGTVSVSVQEANRLELMYSYNVGDTYRSNRTESTHQRLTVGVQQPDPNDNTKVAYDLSWQAGPNDATSVVGYTVRYRQLTDANGDPFLDSDGNPGIWKTYLDGTAQDLRGTRSSPSLTINNLATGSYEFEVVSNRIAMPVERDFNDPASLTFGQALREQVVTLQGGGGNDFISAQKLVKILPGDLADDTFTDPLVWNNPLNPLPFGFIFAPEPVNPGVSRQVAFAAYLDGGAGNDLLIAAAVNGGSGVDYQFQGITFSGLNTMVGGQGSDTFVVKNGGLALGDTFDHVIKNGNETPVITQPGNYGSSLNGGQHNLIVSAVPYLVLSDTIVSQGKYIDQVILSGAGQFAMGNGLDNFLADGNAGGGSNNTLVGGVGRDSIRGGAVGGDVLVGGTAYGVDNVGLAVKDFASIADGGRGLITSIYRDTDPIPVGLNGPATADPSQFWFVPGYYGEVFDPARNRDTLVASNSSILDGGAGHDSLVGSGESDNFIVSGSYSYVRFSEYFLGVDNSTQDIRFQDAVFGNGGNDTVTFTDSDNLWWSGYAQGDILPQNGYRIAGDISNLVLQMGSPTARNGTGNRTSTGNSGNGGNRIVGNEFDNILNGRGVGGDDQKGTGIDYLTGGGGSDNFLIDVYDDGYRNENTYRDSGSNEWNVAIRSIVSNLGTSRHEWLPAQSSYKDFDYVVVRDFETVDVLTLNITNENPLSNYSIGNIPDQLDSPGGNVGPLGNKFTSRQFGIYYTANTFAPGEKQGLYKPNLIAVIQSNYDLLGPDDDGDGVPDALIARPFSPDNTYTDSTVAPSLMGWGRFYELHTSPFAAYINQTYRPADSTADLSILVRSGNDTFLGGAGGDFYNGMGGSDSLLGEGGNDTFLGGMGNDSLFGGAGIDSLLGEDGDDYIDGGTGNDVMIGSTGNDTYFVDSLADVVTENPNAGTDFVVASVSDYFLAANVENLVLFESNGAGAERGSGNGLNNRLIGNSLDNTLHGLGGNDTLIAGGGTNTLDGGLGDDFYIVRTVTDTIEDAGGLDTVISSGSFDLSNPLVAGGTGIENLRLISQNSATLTGNSGNNSITGNIDNDLLVGGGGNDTLRGSSEFGAEELDTLTGGGGADLFVLGASNYPFYNSLAQRGDYAVIMDFSVTEGDMLELTGSLKNSYLVTDTLFGGGSIGASNSYLYLDTNADGIIGNADNLIAAISATGGSGLAGALSTSDITNNPAITRLI